MAAAKALLPAAAARSSAAGSAETGVDMTALRSLLAEDPPTRAAQLRDLAEYTLSFFSEGDLMGRWNDAVTDMGRALLQESLRIMQGDTMSMGAAQPDVSMSNQPVATPSLTHVQVEVVVPTMEEAIDSPTAAFLRMIALYQPLDSINGIVRRAIASFDGRQLVGALDRYMRALACLLPDHLLTRVRAAARDPTSSTFNRINVVAHLTRELTSALREARKPKRVQRLIDAAQLCQTDPLTLASTLLSGDLTRKTSGSVDKCLSSAGRRLASLPDEDDASEDDHDHGTAGNRCDNDRGRVPIRWV